MMSYLAGNIQFLRKKKKLTQAQLASKIGINRSVIGAYEEGRAEPRMSTLVNLAYYFSISLDYLLNKDLRIKRNQTKSIIEETNLRILPILVNRDSGNELIPLVPVKAAAGYSQGYGDIDFIDGLPKFEMPFKELSSEKTYRIFEILGDSMLPVPSGSYIICEYLEDWQTIKDGQCYVLATKDEGILYKRVTRKIEERKLNLSSDNPNYKAYDITIEQILEIWTALGFVSFNLPDPEKNQLDLNKVWSELQGLKEEMKSLKKSK